MAEKTSMQMKLGDAAKQLASSTEMLIDGITEALMPGFYTHRRDDDANHDPIMFVKDTERDVKQQIATAIDHSDASYTKIIGYERDSKVALKKIRRKFEKSSASDSKDVEKLMNILRSTVGKWRSESQPLAVDDSRYPGIVKKRIIASTNDMVLSINERVGLFEVTAPAGPQPGMRIEKRKMRSSAADYVVEVGYDLARRLEKEAAEQHMEESTVMRMLQIDPFTINPSQWMIAQPQEYYYNGRQLIEMEVDEYGKAARAVVKAIRKRNMDEDEVIALLIRKLEKFE